MPYDCQHLTGFPLHAGSLRVGVFLGSSVVFRDHMKTVEQSSGVMSLTSVSIPGPRLHELLLDR
jgi:hypothetical protein